MSERKLVKVDKSHAVKKSVAKERIKGALMFLPNLVKLLGNLMVDKRVPLAEKALVAGAIVYVISPIDLIPDFLPFIGQVDDTYLVALTLLRLITKTDESVIREHWSGGGDIIALIDTILSFAPRILPKRVTRVLTSEVKLSPAGKEIQDVVVNKTPLVTEIPQLDAQQG